MRIKKIFLGFSNKEWYLITVESQVEYLSLYIPLITLGKFTLTVCNEDRAAREGEVPGGHWGGEGEVPGVH